jgi:hypothetical protein
MALIATLELDGKYYDIRDFDYDINKPIDNNNKPSATARGGLINFTILSPMDTNCVFQEWITKNAEVKNGTFFLPLTQGIKHFEKEIAFENAHCVKLSEHYSNTNSSQMFMRISISASVIKFSDTVAYRNNELPAK